MFQSKVKSVHDVAVSAEVGLLCTWASGRRDLIEVIRGEQVLYVPLHAVPRLLGVSVLNQLYLQGSAYQSCPPSVWTALLQVAQPLHSPVA